MSTAVLAPVLPAVLLLVIVLACLKVGLRAGGVCWLAAVAVVVGAMVLNSQLVFMQALLFLLVAGFCAAVRVRPRICGSLCMAATVAAILLVHNRARTELKTLRELRREFPVESVAARLSYETAGGPRNTSDTTPEPLILTPAVAHNLQDFEDLTQGNMRTYMLERLHSRTYEQFVAADGFGVSRMIRVRRSGIELPEVQPVRQPDPPPPRPAYAPSGPDAFAEQAAPQHEARPHEPSAAGHALAKETLFDMHRRGLRDFLAPERMGYARDRDYVVGFEPHRFSSPLAVSSRSDGLDAWQVTRLDLVSLLRHASPVAYVSEHLPAMEDLELLPTRPLDEFESESLPLLKQAEDVVMRQGRNQIRMLGALRAGHRCLTCHSVQRGELLGAFTYVLDRVHALEESIDADPPQARIASPGARIVATSFR